MRFLASWLLTAIIKSIIDSMEILMDFVIGIRNYCRIIHDLF